jgi:serine/threonine protein kinase
MRLLGGGTLRERVADEGVFELKEAARVIRQIAEGLGHAHGKNIIHRDVTPNNIVFDSAGDAYITDFGIAKMMKGTGRFTGTEIMGTPAYISPEQATGESLDHRTDIYALGVVLYEMVIGDIPFHADTPLMMVPRPGQRQGGLTGICRGRDSQSDGEKAG